MDKQTAQYTAAGGIIAAGVGVIYLLENVIGKWPAIILGLVGMGAARQVVQPQIDRAYAEDNKPKKDLAVQQSDMMIKPQNNLPKLQSKPQQPARH